MAWQGVRKLQATNCARALKRPIMQRSKKTGFWSFVPLSGHKPFSHQHLVLRSPWKHWQQLPLWALVLGNALCVEAIQIVTSQSVVHTYGECGSAMGHIGMLFPLKIVLEVAIRDMKKMGANIVLMSLPFCLAKTALISRLMLCATYPILKTPEAGHSNGKIVLCNINMS